jgi:hypothetical protein
MKEPFASALLNFFGARYFTIQPAAVWARAAAILKK